MDEASTDLPPEAEARLRQLQAVQKIRRDAEARERQSRRALWLSHHWQDEYDRCAVIAGHHVCRRCLVLYPVAIAVLIASYAGVTPWPESLDRWFIWLLCIPATFDFLAEKLAGVPYNAWRQTIVTALVALALGRGLRYEIDDRWSWNFWGPVLVFGTIWFVAAVYLAQQSMMQKALNVSSEFGPEPHDQS